eukprot:Seg804.13 transcript_id=Seg804.13/GoldUCD/mRNA.D3Y31 product="hypothetical protein" protein_id=Seg804.13/GoldUCD/D3Y31
MALNRSYVQPQMFARDASRTNAVIGGIATLSAFHEFNGIKTQLTRRSLAASEMTKRLADVRNRLFSEKASITRKLANVMRQAKTVRPILPDDVAASGIVSSGIKLTISRVL